MKREGWQEKGGFGIERMLKMKMSLATKSRRQNNQGLEKKQVESRMVEKVKEKKGVLLKMEKTRETRERRME